MADADDRDVYDDLVDAHSGAARQLADVSHSAASHNEAEELRLRLAAAMDEVCDIARTPCALQPYRRFLRPTLQFVRRSRARSAPCAALAPSQVERLKGENEVLRRNISTLYNTAKLEIARKDKQIAALRAPASR